MYSPLSSAVGEDLDENLVREREILLENKRDESIQQNEIYDLPEIHQNNHRLLKDLDSRSGIFSDTYYTKYDKGKLGVSYSHSVNIDDLIEVQSFDVNYMRTFEDSWKEYWWGIQYKFTTANLEAVSDSQPSSTNDDRQNYSFFGIGAAHRFYTIAHFFNADRMFEMVNIYFNYVLHRDNFEEQNYTGFGYTAEYSFSFRSSKTFFWGGKLSYNWALVEKPREDEEPLTDRSRVFGWTTIGFELGYIF